MSAARRLQRLELVPEVSEHLLRVVVFLFCQKCPNQGALLAAVSVYTEHILQNRHSIQKINTFYREHILSIKVPAIHYSLYVENTFYL